MKVTTTPVVPMLETEVTVVSAGLDAGGDDDCPDEVMTTELCCCIDVEDNGTVWLWDWLTLADALVVPGGS